MAPYRRLNAYLEALPAGLSSYPSCVERGSVSRTWFDKHPLTPSPELPEALRAYIAAPPKPMAWVPKAVANAVYLAQCDEHFPSDEAYIEFSYEQNRAFYQSSVFRPLMALTSPTSFLQAMRLMWKLLHRGTNLNLTTSTANQITGTLEYPPHLVPELVARCFATAFRGAVEATTLFANLQVEIESLTPERAVYVASWERSKK